MTERNPDKRYEISIARQLELGLGSTGSLTARCAYEIRHQRLKKMLDVKDEAVFQREIEKVFTQFYADSERPAEEIFEGTFAGESELKLAMPKQFALLTSHAGSTLIERANTPPFEHLKRWDVDLAEIIDKSAQCEAEGIRLFGTANLLVNIQNVWQQLSRAVKQTENVKNSPEWLRLRSRRVSLNPILRVVNIYFSSAGGQASGAVVLMLGLLNKLLEEDRQNCLVRLHFLVPGFYANQSEAELMDQRLKTQSVIRDFQQMRQRGTTLYIPFPRQDKLIQDTTQLFDEIFVHEPLPTVSKDNYKTFVRRIAGLVVDMELAPYARGLRSMRSNSAASTRLTDKAQRRFA